MNTEIEKAIKLLAEKITSDVKSDDALKFTQAALNLAHTVATLEGMNMNPIKYPNLGVRGNYITPLGKREGHNAELRGASQLAGEASRSNAELGEED